MKFSIIICTYNSVNKLPKTLDSILAQTYDGFEAIVIDGASMDGTLDIIRDYEKKFSGKLKWISEPDSGIYDAMNKGIKMAGGEFLLVIGAGDWLEIDALEHAKKCIEKNSEADAVYGITRVWDKNLENSRIVQTLPEILPTQPMQHPALFYKKMLHEKFGLYDENYKIVADYVFCLNAFFLGKAKVALFDFVASNFVMDGNSSKKKIKCLWENIRIRKNCGLKTQLFRDLKLYLKNLVTQ